MRCSPCYTSHPVHFSPSFCLLKTYAQVLVRWEWKLPPYRLCMKFCWTITVSEIFNKWCIMSHPGLCAAEKTVWLLRSTKDGVRNLFLVGNKTPRGCRSEESTRLTRIRLPNSIFTSFLRLSRLDFDFHENCTFSGEQWPWNMSMCHAFLVGSETKRWVPYHIWLTTPARVKTSWRWI